jgi:hypothetical protein
MWYSAIAVIMAVLVAVGYRRSMPVGTVIGWRDRVWIASMVFAVQGMGLIGFIFGRSGLAWPDNAIASVIVGAIAVVPLAACFILGLARQAR